MAETPPERDLFDLDDAEAKRRVIATARALPRETDVPMADVVRWLESWGKPDESPPPWTK